MNKSIFENYSKKKYNDCLTFCDEYKNFISQCKTEREVVKYFKTLAEKNGFLCLDEVIKSGKTLKVGDKVYATNMNKNIALFVVGEENIENGFNIIGSHIDSPRLDLKAKTVYEDNELCLLDTHYYGGIKKYQWVALPLALHGIVCKKDGTNIDLCIGENDNDPVFTITELLPHLDKSQKTEVIKGDALNVIAGSTPDLKAEKNKIKQNVLNILKTYDIEEDDLFSTEIEIVPAGKSRDLGFDKSMVIGYGQDDRVCAYTSFMAMLNQGTPKRTTLCLMVDKEEIGSNGATGMQSRFFENTIAEFIASLGKFNDLTLRRALKNSKMLSSDVTAGFEPNNPEPSNKDTEAYLGRGIAFCKYTGSRGKYDANDANPEFIAEIRNAFDKAKIGYQATEMGKVDAGGGGTIAYLMASYGMQVIDAGVPVLGMHSPWEVTNKLDIYETYLAYITFYNM